MSISLFRLPGFATFAAFHFWDNVLVEIGIVISAALMLMAAITALVNSCKVSAVLTYNFLYPHPSLSPVV